MPIPSFNQLIRRIEQLGASTEVTHYNLALGSLDSGTGHYGQGYTPATIDMIISHHPPRHLELPVGGYSESSATGITDTAMSEGDKIEDANETDWLVVSVQEISFGDKTVGYSCELAARFPYETGAAEPYPWPAPPVTGGISLNVGAVTWEAISLDCFLTRDVVAYDHTTATCSISSSFVAITPYSHTTKTCSIATVLSVNVA